MSTKLAEPIIIRIESVEEAIGLYHRENGATNQMFECYKKNHCGLRDPNLIEGYFLSGYVWEQIADELKSRSIDPWTWTPEPPLKVGDYDAEFLPDGSVKVGRTTVAPDLLDKIAERSKALRVKEPEWPKFWQDTRGHVYRAISELDPGDVWGESKRWVPCTAKTPMTQDAKDSPGLFKPITRAEAEKIIGRKIE